MRSGTDVNTWPPRTPTTSGPLERGRIHKAVPDAEKSPREMLNALMIRYNAAWAWPARTDRDRKRQREGAELLHAALREAYPELGE